MSLRTSETASPEAIKKLAEMNLDQVIRIKTLESLIQGFQDAMRPLLDEWESLKIKKEREG